MIRPRHTRPAVPIRLPVALVLALALTGAAPVAAQHTASAALPPQPRPLDDERSLAGSGLSNPRVIEGIHLDLEGKHDAALEVWRTLRAADPSDPTPVVFETSTLFWLMVYDDEDTRYDERIARSCDQAIDLATDRVEADDSDAEAHFLLGQALMHRGRLNGWRGRYYKAGRDGEKARHHLERALALRPGWTDARYQVGLYYFYASLIPQLVTRWLGWLWFIPTGNAETGIAYLRDVAENGELFRDEAQFMLANIYVYHRPENREIGLAMMQAVTARYPDNVFFQFELLEALYENGHPEEAIEQADRLALTEPRSPREQGRIDIAPVWKARAEILRDRPDRALEILAPFLANPPARPLWGSAWIDLVRGNALDSLGRREEALVQYERVLGYKSEKRSRRASELAELAIATPFQPDRPTEIRAEP